MTEKTNKRKLMRDKNRLALIEATLDCVAELGIAHTSVSAIIERAGLSRGMIHLHFESKDKLLEAAVAHAAQVYDDAHRVSLASAGSSPQEIIEAAIRCDLGETVLNRRNVINWHAFRGEAHQRAAIRAHSDTRDYPLGEILFKAFAELPTVWLPKDASTLADDAAEGVMAMIEGLWVDYLLHPEDFDRVRAIRICFRFLAALYPQHFDLNGALTVQAHQEAV